jgi:multidrug efflux pump subunit AcrA (membrane-fusion protein)
MATAALARMRPGRLPPIRGRWLLLIGLLALALIGWFLWTQYTSSQNVRPSYQTAQVTQGTLRNTVAATGPIANPTSVPVSFKNPGELIEVNVSIGDRVTPGQVLARQRPDDLATAVRQAEASYEQALAAEQEVLEGPTDEVVGQADATLEEARVSRESAVKSLEATQTTASAAINAATIEVVSARVSLDGAEKELTSAVEQRDAALASAEQAVENAQVALENARIAHESAVAQAATSNVEAQIQVDSSLNDVASARANQAATEEVGQQSGVSDQVSVANARQELQDAQRELEAQKRTTEKELVVQRRQRDQAGVSARSAQQERQQACANGNDNTSACNAAKRSENEARASLRTAEAQLNQAEAAARQTMIQAASAVTNAQSAVRTAEASINTGLANTRQSNTSSRASVKSAEDALRTAMATAASTRTQNAANVAQAKTSVDSAEATLRTAMKTLESERVQQQAAVVQAQNALEQARVAVRSAEAGLENTRASQASSIQSAQNTVNQQEASLGSAQAQHAVETAESTAAQIEQARAATRQQAEALATARYDLESSTLVSPTEGTVASISGVVGQWVSGSGSSNSNGTSASTTSATAVSSTGATNATGGFITLTEIGTLQVTPQVSEADIARVVPGQGITFTVNAFPGQTFTGQVLSIQPVGQTVSNVVVYNVICMVDRTETRLLPAMTATVNIIVEQQDDVILIPTSAIAYARSQLGAAAARGTPTTATGKPSGKPGSQADQGPGTPAVVLVLKDGEAVPTPIRVGSSDDQNTVVLSGLEVGDRVVIGQTVAAPQSLGTSLFGPKPGGGGGGPQQKPGGGGGAPKPGGG